MTPVIFKSVKIQEQIIRKKHYEIFWLHNTESFIESNHYRIRAVSGSNGKNWFGQEIRYDMIKIVNLKRNIYAFSRHSYVTVFMSKFNVCILYFLWVCVTHYHFNHNILNNNLCLI